MRTTASYLRLILLIILSICFMEWIYETGDEWAMLTEPLFWVIISAVTLFAFAIEISVGTLSVLLFKSLNKKEQEQYLVNEELRQAEQFKWVKEKYKAALGSKAIEEEHEIILDHNYDGIRELDNKLPPWWVYGFYATIVFAVIYLIRFEVFNDYTQEEEFKMAMAEAKAEVEAWKRTAKNLVDVNTVTLLTEGSDLAAGKSIFNTNCIACHKEDGGGGIGPNLVDDYWVLGGGIKNVFNTISEGGRSGKGMIPWKTELKPLEMAQVASYVLSLKGTTPAEPKAPEGEIWIDPDALEEVDIATIDSTIVNDTKENKQVLNDSINKD